MDNLQEPQQSMGNQANQLGPSQDSIPQVTDQSTSQEPQGPASQPIQAASRPTQTFYHKDGLQEPNDIFSQILDRQKKIEEYQQQGQQHKVDELKLNELGDSINQEVRAKQRGSDPLHDWGGTQAFSPEIVSGRFQRLMAEKLGQLDAVYEQHGPEIDELRSIWQKQLTSVQQANGEKLSDLHAMTPEQAFQRSSFFKMNQDERAAAQQKIVKIDKAMRAIDPGFSIFKRPETADFARGIGQLTEHETGERATGLGAVGNILQVAGRAAEGAADVAAPFVGNVLDAAGLFGDYVLRGVLSEDTYNDVQGKILAKTGWTPDMVGASVPGPKDAQGRQTFVKQRFGLPELISPLGAAMLGSSAKEFAQGAREAQAVHEAYGSDGWGWGIAGDVSNFVGGMAGFGGVMKGGAMAWQPVKGAIAKGMAAVGAKVSARTAAIADVLAGPTAGIASMGTYETLAYGHTDGYTHSFTRGAETGLAFWALGAMGGQTEKLLLRNKMPSFLSQAVGSAFEGAGMAGYSTFADTPAGTALWGFLKDPSHETWNGFRGELGRDMLGMVVHKAIFGKNARMQALLESKSPAEIKAAMQPEAPEVPAEAAAAPGEEGIPLEEAAKPPLGGAKSQMLVGEEPAKALPPERVEEKQPEPAKSSSKGRVLTDDEVEFLMNQEGEIKSDAPPAFKDAESLEGERFTPHEISQLAKYREEIGPVARAIGAAGRREAKIGRARGEVPQIQEPGALSTFKPGVRTVDMHENLAERLISGSQRQTERRIKAREGAGKDIGGIEWGIAGAHIGGKFTFSATKGTRTTSEKGPSWKWGEAVEKLRDRMSFKGMDDAAIEKQINEGQFVTAHRHPGESPFSGEDLNIMRNVFNEGPGQRAHAVFTDSGLFVASPKENVPLKEVDANKSIKSNQSKVGLEFAQALRENKDLPGVKRSDMEAIRGMDATSFLRRLEPAGRRHGEVITTGSRSDRALGRIQRVAYAEAVKRTAADMGMDVSYHEGREGINRWGAYQESGDISELTGQGKSQAVLQREQASAEAGQKFVQSFGVAAETPLHGQSREKQEELARNYKALQRVGMTEERAANFLKLAEDSLGGDIAGLAPTSANVERVMRMAGIRTGAPKQEGGQIKASFGTHAEPSDVEMAQMRRQQEQMTPPGVPKQKALSDLFGTAREEQPPTDEQASKMLDKMLGVESELTKPAKPMFQRLKSMTERAAKAVGSFFSDPSTRELVASRIEKLGYRSKFMKLGADENFVLGATDQLQRDMRSSHRTAMADLSAVYKPIGENKKLTNEEVKQQTNDVQSYALLNDLYSNYIRERTVPKKDEAGQPVVDAEGKPVTEQQLYTTPLPGGATIDQVQAKLKEVGARLSPEGRQAYQRLRTVLDQAFQSQVDRGLTTEASYQKNYYPRRVLDYADVVEGIGPARVKAGGPIEPFRGWLKERAGSERLLDARMEALHSYLTGVKLTNAIHDYHERVSQGIQDRLYSEHGLSQEKIDEMDPKEWAETQQRLEKDAGAVVVDIRRGGSGKQTLERDPIHLDTQAQIAEETGMRLTPEAVVGRGLRPDPESGRYLVTKPALELFREQRLRTSWMANPVLRLARQAIGKWFKGPAMRGLGGLRVPGRAFRNIYSDLTAVAMKGTAADLAGTIQYMKGADQISRALANKDQDKALGELSPYLQSMAQEFMRFGTGKTGFWTSEAEGVRSTHEGEFIKRMMPETTNWLGKVSQYARGDFEWARKMDDYAENLVRVAYFMRERMGRFRAITENPELLRAGESQEVDATRFAHIKVGEVLVNYDHLTPFERVGLNGLAFPFYTWIKGNFTKTLAELVRHPANSLGKYAAYSGVFSMWNWMMAPDEEQRLMQLRPDLSAKGHIFIPYLRDEFGNPFMMQFEDTFTEATKFMGLSGAMQKGEAFAVHQNPDLLFRDLFVGGYDTAKKAFRDWTSPLLRSAMDMGYASKFETFGERAEQAAPAGLKAFLPASDVGSFLNIQKDKSWQERALTPLPMVGFLDLTAGTPLSQASGQFEAGRLQRQESQVSTVVKKGLQRFEAGMRSGDVNEMGAAVERAWKEVGSNMQEAGMAPIHLWARMIQAAEHNMQRKAISAAGGDIPPKFFELSKSQQAEWLMRQYQ